MPHENHKTHLGGTDLPPFLYSPLEMREAFIAAHEWLSMLARQARRPMVLVAAVDVHARVVDAVGLGSGHSLVIGRHTGCGLRLGCDSLSLRHLVAHAGPAAPGTPPLLWLWELHTGRPFMTEDGRFNAAVRTQGPLYAAVGPYALLFLPLQGHGEAPWPARAEEAWRALPARRFLDQRSAGAAAPPRTGRRRLDGRPYQTEISPLGALLTLSEPGEPESPWAELRLEWEGRVERHFLSREHLGQGVLLGRYERCGIRLSQGLGALSRVHLLLVRLGEEVLAIDTASTNGTWRGPTRIETTRLHEQDSLVLGRTLRLDWRRLHPTGTERG
ncbi:MAG TPA: FHA domain-containing protein [Archangium sp.]|uniref:FHA domain-containing protein n=1 Tax=Archangium sp. TaxID=1872627 RepID=UPI002E2F2FAC|nr:FHA domain-containing protein [Archangium sp.]HEX5751832.1 FHA domain-containing protein [Archangium sp.]